MDSSLNPTLGRLLSYFRLDRTWVRGRGVWLTDVHGRRFLDCSAQYGAVVLGHNSSEVSEAVHSALADQIPALVQPYRAPHAVALASELTEVAPGQLTRCVFSTSGAEAVEAAIKLARSSTDRPMILSALGSFHGKTTGALAATGQTQHAEGFGPLPPEFEHVAYGDAEAVRRRFRIDGSRIAALLLEPIQAERGVHLPPPGYMRQVRDECTQHGVALILDEIQTGLGRTGRMFACEEEGVVPDILLLGKALGGGLFPLSACLSTTSFWNERFAFGHSSTFAGNNVACRAGQAVLKTLRGVGFCEEVARKGERLLEGLRRLVERYPGLFVAARGRGLMTGLELRGPGPLDGAFLSVLAQHGLYAYAVAATIADIAGILVLPTLGDANVLRVTPPLNISDEEIELALQGIERVCGQLADNRAETIVRALGGLTKPERRVSGRTVVAPSALVMPAPRRRSGPLPQYAFLIHPTQATDLIRTNPGLERISERELASFCDYLAELPPVLVQRAPPVRSVTGDVAEGVILSVPLLPAEMVRRGSGPVGASIAQAVELARQLGVQLVGLGGYTAPYSQRGRTVVGCGPAITTGNALTAGMAYTATCRVAERSGLCLRDATVGVVGASGSVGSLCARLFARGRPRRLLLAGRPGGSLRPLQRLAQGLSVAGVRVDVAREAAELSDCDILVTATAGSPGALDDLSLASGVLICDVARPADTSSAMRSRADLFVFDGGLVTMPDPRTCFGAGNILGMPAGIQLSCLAETILLTLERHFQDHGIGDAVALDQVDFVMRLAERHGFGVWLPDVSPAGCRVAGETTDR